MYAFMFTMLAVNAVYVWRIATRNAIVGDDDDDAHYYAMLGYYHSRLINEIRTDSPFKLRSKLSELRPADQTSETMVA